MSRACIAPRELAGHLEVTRQHHAAPRPAVGRLTGVRDGQIVRSTRQHVGEVIVWFGEQSIDWSRPVTIEVDGKAVFSGSLTQNAGLALARAKATMDFERLCFAGVRVNVSGDASIITAATMPEPAWRR